MSLPESTTLKRRRNIYIYIKVKSSMTSIKFYFLLTPWELKFSSQLPLDSSNNVVLVLLSRRGFILKKSASHFFC